MTNNKSPLTCDWPERAPQYSLAVLYRAGAQWGGKELFEQRDQSGGGRCACAQLTVGVGISAGSSACRPSELRTATRYDTARNATEAVRVVAHAAALVVGILFMTQGRVLPEDSWLVRIAVLPLSNEGHTSVGQSTLRCEQEREFVSDSGAVWSHLISLKNWATSSAGK